MEDESGEEDNVNATLVTSDVRDLLLIKRPPNVKKAPYEESQRNKSLI